VASDWNSEVTALLVIGSTRWVVCACRLPPCLTWKTKSEASPQVNPAMIKGISVNTRGMEGRLGECPGAATLAKNPASPHPMAQAAMGNRKASPSDGLHESAFVTYRRESARNITQETPAKVATTTVSRFRKCGKPWADHQSVRGSQNASVTKQSSQASVSVVIRDFIMVPGFMSSLHLTKS
jgi:hypothetical protein